MKQERVFQVLVAPHISEKASLAGDKRQFVFKVEPSANKLEVKKAVEKLFDVKVKGVRICNMKGKVKRFGRSIGKRNGMKKAYITLQEGYDIEYMGAD